MKSAKIITESTLIPLSLVMTFGAAIFWTATLYNEVKSIAEQMNELDKKISKTIEEMRYEIHGLANYQREIDKRLSRIEGALNQK